MTLAPRGAEHGAGTGQDGHERPAILDMMESEEHARADEVSRCGALEHRGGAIVSSDPRRAPASIPAGRLSAAAAGEALRVVLELWGGRAAPA